MIEIVLRVILKMESVKKKRTLIRTVFSRLNNALLESVKNNGNVILLKLEIRNIKGKV